MSLTGGARSTVSVDQSTVNIGRVRTGPVGLRVGPVWAGPGRAVHVARCDAATSRPWALTGPWSMAAVYGGLSGAGPWTTDWSMVDRVHLSPPRRGPGTSGARAGGRRGGCSPAFPTAALLPAVIFTNEPLWRGWCLIGVGKSFPGPRRLRLWGQGGDQSSPRCWPWRAVAR